MKIIGIYKIVSPTGRVYIGQSRHVKKRLRSYLSNYGFRNQIRLKHSFEKHGIESHIFSIEKECHHEDLNRLERYYQDLYDCIGKNGLNCMLTTADGKQKIYTEESKRKMSEGRTGEKNHMFGRRGKDHPGFGKKASQQARINLSIAAKGIKKSEAHKRNIGIKQIGGGNHQAKLVFDTETGIFYDCVKDASIAKNLTNLNDWLNEKRNARNRSSLIYA